MKHDPDDTIARLLRARLEPRPPEGSCLDAELVAAWFDGTLTSTEQREAARHASTCTRCQALLATMAQAEPVAAPRPHRLRLVRWFAPALVAAAAVLVWINVADRSADIPPVPSSVAPAPAPARPAEAQQGRPPQTAPHERKPAAPSAEPVNKRSAPAAVNESVTESKEPLRKTLDARAEASPAAAPTNEPATGAAAGSVPLTANRDAQLKDEQRLLQTDTLAAAVAVPLVVRSPDGSLWRITGDAAVGRSTDGGATWREQRLGASAHLLAGSSPSPNVVWFGGAGGIVVVTTDGASWHWRSIPGGVDVTSIAAVDGQTATATTRGGRRFVTHDGGLTWVPAPAQENPAAPF
ncbi:MAG TPA: hypothetical protein VL262_08965 [Vicinamibacterales bacterium]|nr:hypothetical protein [Vicinamibacterales bacterium]